MRCLKLFLMFLCLFSLHQASVHASDIPCAGNRPALQTSEALKDQPKQLVIKAQQMEINLNQTAQFEGQVVVAQDRQLILADKALFYQPERIIEAEGHLSFYSAGLVLQASQVQANLTTKACQIQDTRYWLPDQKSHGYSDSISISPQKEVSMINASFTQCPDHNKTWSVSSQAITYSQDKQLATFKEPTINIYDVPVFKLPYAQISLNKNRQSGLLMPRVNFHNRKLRLDIPIYWNIAPQVDNTFTPNLSDRGTLLKNELRYLTPYQQGRIQGEYIHEDAEFNKQRYAYLLQHRYQSGDHWMGMLQFQNVADGNYFREHLSDIQNQHTTQINRYGHLTYRSEQWRVAAHLKDIKLLDHTLPSPYQVFPEVNVEYQSYQWLDRFDVQLNHHTTQFIKRNHSNEQALRMHSSFQFTWPLVAPEGSLISSVKLMHTYYQQQFETEKTIHHRFIPQFKVNAQLRFERPISWFDQPLTQTLEPQLQYLYVPYRDQRTIRRYDTSLLSEDRYLLFRERRYAGLDRLADLNQVTLGISSRILQSNTGEIAKLSLGQIIYMTPSRTERDDFKMNSGDKTLDSMPSSSPFVVNLSMQPWQDWHLESEWLYDVHHRKNKQVASYLSYQSEQIYTQLSHRFKFTSVASEQINQTGFRFLFPIGENFQIHGNFYYDHIKKRSVERRLGVQYNACCWGIALSFSQQLSTEYDDAQKTWLPDGQFDQNFEFSFYLPFSSSRHQDLKSRLNQGIFNYREPIYLQN
jgi:LPS-assembly protein